MTERRDPWELARDLISLGVGNTQNELVRALLGDEALGSKVINCIEILSYRDIMEPTECSPDKSGIKEVWYRGAVIEGIYKVGNQIGVGGSGIVFEGEQLSSGSDSVNLGKVAIKVLYDSNPFATDTEKDVWNREIKALRETDDLVGIAKLQHAGFDNQDRPYIITKYVEGGDLKSKLESSADGFGAKQTREYLIQIVETLVGIHSITSEFELVHCDLKPSNIIINKENRPVIIDFGVARLSNTQSGLSTQTYSSNLGSTPSYRVPENVLENKNKLDPRSDIFQVGLIGFEMLTGKPYWRCSPEDRLLLLDKYLDNLSADLREIELAWQLDRAVHVIQKALRWNPSERYQSATAMLDELTSQPPPSQPKPFWTINKFVLILIFTNLVLILSLVLTFQFVDNKIETLKSQLTSTETENISISEKFEKFRTNSERSLKDKDETINRRDAKITSLLESSIRESNRPKDAVGQISPQINIDFRDVELRVESIIDSNLTLTDRETALRSASRGITDFVDTYSRDIQKLPKGDGLHKKLDVINRWKQWLSREKQGRVLNFEKITLYESFTPFYGSGWFRSKTASMSLRVKLSDESYRTILSPRDVDEESTPLASVLNTDIRWNLTEELSIELLVDGDVVSAKTLTLDYVNNNKRFWIITSEEDVPLYKANLTVRWPEGIPTPMPKLP